MKLTPSEKLIKLVQIKHLEPKGKNYSYICSTPAYNVTNSLHADYKKKDGSS